MFGGKYGGNAWNTWELFVGKQPQPHTRFLCHTVPPLSLYLECVRGKGELGDHGGGVCWDTPGIHVNPQKVCL